MRRYNVCFYHSRYGQFEVCENHIMHHSSNIQNMNSLTSTCCENAPHLSFIVVKKCHFRWWYPGTKETARSTRLLCSKSSYAVCECMNLVTDLCGRTTGKPARNKIGIRCRLTMAYQCGTYLWPDFSLRRCIFCFYRSWYSQCKVGENLIMRQVSHIQNINAVTPTCCENAPHLPVNVVKKCYFWWLYTWTKVTAGSTQLMWYKSSYSVCDYVRLASDLCFRTTAIAIWNKIWIHCRPTMSKQYCNYFLTRFLAAAIQSLLLSLLIWLIRCPPKSYNTPEQIHTECQRSNSNLLRERATSFCPCGQKMIFLVMIHRDKIYSWFYAATAS